MAQLKPAIQLVGEHKAHIHSDDETDAEETAKQTDQRAKVMRTIPLPWRSHSLTRLLHNLDAIANHEGMQMKGTGRRRGRQSDKVIFFPSTFTHQSSRDVPVELPINFYNVDWLSARGINLQRLYPGPADPRLAL